MDNWTDEQIIEQIRQGDQEAYRVLVERHKNYIFTLMYRELGHPETAEDLTQDIFVKLFRSLVHFRGDSKFTTWLYRLAVNTLTDYRRSQKRRPLSILQSIKTWFQDNRSEEPEQMLLEKEEQMEVQKVMHQLKDKYRIVLELYHIRQLSYQEIAVILNVPLRTVETQIYRAKQQFKQKWLEVQGHETKPKCSRETKAVQNL